MRGGLEMRIHQSNAVVCLIAAATGLGLGQQSLAAPMTIRDSVLFDHTFQSTTFTDGARGTVETMLLPPSLRGRVLSHQAEIQASGQQSVTVAPGQSLDPDVHNRFMSVEVGIGVRPPGVNGVRTLSAQENVPIGQGEGTTRSYTYQLAVSQPGVPAFGDPYTITETFIEFNYGGAMRFLGVTGGGTSTSGFVTGTVSNEYVIDTEGLSDETIQVVEQLEAIGDTLEFLPPTAEPTPLEWFLGEALDATRRYFPEPDTGPTNPFNNSGTGIRGDAGEIIRELMRATPNSEIGELGLEIRTGSPTTVATVFETPDDPFDLSFDYAFLSEGASLSLLVAGVEIALFEAEAQTLGTLENFSIEIDWVNEFTDLAFVIDGPEADLGAILLAVSINGNNLLSTSEWGVGGGGRAQFIISQTEEERARMVELTVASPVPLPAGAWFFLSALGMGVRIRRARSVAK